MRKISLFRLIATENPAETKKLLAEYGVPTKSITSIRGAVGAMKKLSLKDATFREKLIAIHPHKTLFDTVHDKDTKKLIEERDHYSNMVDELQEEQLSNSNNYNGREHMSFQGDFLDEYASADAIKNQNMNIKITNVALGVGIGLGVAVLLGALVKMYVPSTIISR